MRKKTSKKCYTFRSIPSFSSIYRTAIFFPVYVCMCSHCSRSRQRVSADFELPIVSANGTICPAETIILIKKVFVVIIVPTLLPHTTFFMWQRNVRHQFEQIWTADEEWKRNGRGAMVGREGGKGSDDDGSRDQAHFTINIHGLDILWSEYQKIPFAINCWANRMWILHWFYQLARVLSVDSRNVQICGQYEYRKRMDMRKSEKKANKTNYSHSWKFSKRINCHPQ